MNPISWLIEQGQRESSPTYSGIKWVHYLTFVSLGTSVLYFTLELDKVAGKKAGQIKRAVT